MSEILSVGKSIKIIRYLDKLNIVKDGFQEFIDFKKIFKDKLSSELTLTKPVSSTSDLLYFDESLNQPSKKLIDCAT